LETDWLNLWGDVLAIVLDVAEGLIGSAIEVWNSSLPFVLDLIEYIRRYG